MPHSLPLCFVMPLGCRTQILLCFPQLRVGAEGLGAGDPLEEFLLMGYAYLVLAASVPAYLKTKSESFCLHRLA